MQLARLHGIPFRDGDRRKLVEIAGHDKTQGSGHFLIAHADKMAKTIYEFIKTQFRITATGQETNDRFGISS